MKKVALLVLVLAFITGFNVLAQGFDDDPWGNGEIGGGGGGAGEPELEVPIDGGALALLAGGAALGYRSLKKRRESNNKKS